MGKILNLLLLLFLITTSLPDPATAAPGPQEELIGRNVISGYYAIWNYPDQPDRYQAVPTGSTQLGNLSLGQSVPSHYADFVCPFVGKSKDYQNIRVEVKSPLGISQQDYDKSAIWNPSIDYDAFKEKYLRVMPQGFNVSMVSSATQYQNVRVKWDLTLGSLLDVVDIKKEPDLLSYYAPSWGSNPPSGFANATKAYLWTLPVMIEWYGIPKGKHDLQFTDAAPQLVGGIEVGKTVNGNIGIKNLAAWPTIASYTKMRVYTWAEGESKPELHNQGGTSSKPISLDGLGEGWLTFSFKVPPKPFRLILTANIYNNGGSYVNEPLVVTTDSGPLSKPEEEYAKNKVEVFLVPSLPGSDGGGGGSTPANLAVTALELLDINGNPVGGTLTAGKVYQVKAKYQSTFDIAGSARFALFCKDSAGNVRQIGSNVWKSLSPRGTTENTWTWSAGSDSTLIATINLDWRGGTTFNNMPFEGQNEVTYADNKRELSTTVGDAPPVPPTPQRVSTTLYYHPEVTEMVPVYKTVQETIHVPIVIKIKYTKDPRQARVKSVLVQ